MSINAATRQDASTTELTPSSKIGDSVGCDSPQLNSSFFDPSGASRTPGSSESVSDLSDSGGEEELLQEVRWIVMTALFVRESEFSCLDCFL